MGGDLKVEEKSVGKVLSGKDLTIDIKKGENYYWFKFSHVDGLKRLEKEMIESMVEKLKKWIEFQDAKNIILNKKPLMKRYFFSDDWEFEFEGNESTEFVKMNIERKGHSASPSLLPILNEFKEFILENIGKWEIIEKVKKFFD